MRAREAEARLELIGALMDRGQRWPGLSAGACFTAAGGAVGVAAWCASRGLGFTATSGNAGAYARPGSAVAWWSGLACLSLLVFLVSTAAGALRRGDPPVSRRTWAALLSIFPGLFAGACFSPVLPPGLLPAAWMLCYGSGVSALGYFSGFPATVTGLLFLLAGALSLYTPLGGFPNAMMAASFGGLHALLGTLLLLSRKPHDEAVHFDPIEDR